MAKNVIMNSEYLQTPIFEQSNTVQSEVNATSNAITLTPIATCETGVFDESAAEIVDYDPDSQRLFVVNANSTSIDVLNISDPTNLVALDPIDVSPFGAVVNSVDVFDGVLAVAVENEDTQMPGSVGFKNHAGILETFTFNDLPTLGTTAAGQTIQLGGFSGLFFEGVNPNNGNLQFITHPDRGPNGEPMDTDGDGIEERPFALPDFQPEIVRFELNQSSGGIEITDRVKLTGTDGMPLTGLPNLKGSSGLAYSDEIPIDLQGNQLNRDPLGADLEGIVRAADSTYWMVDEYRPAIYHFDTNGQLIDRFVPEGSNTSDVITGTEALPAVYAQRRANRGFEAIALEDEKLYAFIQSPIDNPDVTNDANSKSSVNIRILEFDTATGTTTGQYLYVLEGGQSDKIGDAVSLDNGEFLVLERDDATGLEALKNVFRINLAGATNLNDLEPSIQSAGGSLESLTSEQLAEQGIQPVQKELSVDLVAAGYDFADKPEGLALIDENTLAVINDNDFGLSGGFDPATGRLEENPNPQVPVLGLITLNRNGLDISGTTTLFEITSLDSSSFIFG